MFTSIHFFTCWRLSRDSSWSQLLSELLHDWRFTANPLVLASNPLRIKTRDFFKWTLAIIALMYILCDERPLSTVLIAHTTYSMLIKFLAFAKSKPESNLYCNLGQSASLSWCQATIWGPWPNFATVRQSRVSWCGAPPLTRGRICILTAAAGSRQRSLSRVRVSRDSWPDFTVSNLRLPQPGGIDSRTYFLRNRVTQIYPQTLGVSYRLAFAKPKSKLYYDRRSVDQFVLVSCPFWSKWPDVTFIWVTITFFIFHVGRTIWREDGAVICSAMTQAQFQVTLRPTVCRPVRLGTGPPMGHITRF
jgi:hypothetical protein